LDSEFFNRLVAPDATGLLLRWLSDSEAFRKPRSDTEWKAFVQQCKTEFHFDPGKDGPLKAVRLMVQRSTPWHNVWLRFTESPANYPGILWLNRAAPKSPSLFDTAEVWPSLNESEERSLREELESLADRPQDEVIRRIAELEAQHGSRRYYPCQSLGLSPLATALEPLAELAVLCKSVPGAPGQWSEDLESARGPAFQRKCAVCRAASLHTGERTCRRSRTSPARILGSTAGV